MLKKLLASGLLLAASIGAAYLAWATVLPAPASWTMYSAGLNTASNTIPFSITQDAAAAAYFKNYSNSPTATVSCKRMFYGTQIGVGPYVDMQWQNNAWSPCTWNYTAVTYTNSASGIAPAVGCSPASLDSRCHLLTSASNAKNIGCPQCNGDVHVGNPINPGTGNKYQVETDFEVPGSPWLSLRRHYNSSAAAYNRASFGFQWRHSMEYRLRILPGGVLEFERPDGSVKRYVTGAGFDADETSTVDAVFNPAGAQTGWSLNTRQGQVESYDMRGRVTRVDFQQGGYLAYAYPAATVDQPSSVADHFGRAVGFTYDASNRLTKVTTPAGAAYQYGYVTGSLLGQVTKPDGAVRKYLYDESAHDGTKTYLVGQLTGITDESVNRFATYKYDLYGRAFSTEHAGGAQKFTVAYGNDGASATVTGPLAATQAFSFNNLLSRFKATSAATSCSDGSCALATALTYDTKGNITSTLDAANNKACFAYDSLNQLTKKVEGLGPADSCSSALSAVPATARATTVQWSAALRKPTAIASSLYLASMTYDPQGRLLSLTETPTADSNGGSGLGAVASGTARVQSFAYNAAGQLLSVTGPRTNQVTTFVYDAQGNLTKATQPSGLMTTMGAYDGDGRARSLTLPSSAAVALTYDANGRPLTYTVDGEATALTYFPTGLLKTAATPDGETLTFGYDAAQRLTSVTDARGQKIALTLNAQGQATTQQVQYAGGAVFLSASRVFDMLGRLKQTTGAQAL